MPVGEAELLEKTSLLETAKTSSISLTAPFASQPHACSFSSRNDGRIQV